MDPECQFGLSDWIPEETLQCHNKENRSRHFSIGIWQGEKSELQEDTTKNKQSWFNDFEENIWEKRSAINLNVWSRARNDALLRQRTHSDNDPLSDVTNRASINFSVNRLSLDNVQSDVQNAVDDICSSDSPGNSCDSMKFDARSQMRDSHIGLTGRLAVPEHLMTSIVDNANRPLSPNSINQVSERGVTCVSESTTPRHLYHHAIDAFDSKNKYVIRKPPPFDPQCHHMNTKAMNDLRLNDTSDLSGVSLTAPPVEFGFFDRPRRPILKSQSTNGTPSPDTTGRVNAVKLHEMSHGLKSSAFDSKRFAKVPSLMMRQRNKPNLNDDLISGNMQTSDASRKLISFRSESVNYRNLKKKFPPEYFTQTDKCVFEFFRDYRISVFLTYPQRLQAESAVGIRNQVSQVDDNPFKHLPIHCLKGVLSGSISALDFGLNWQWLADTVSKNSLRSMLLALVAKYPNLLDSWKLLFSEETSRHARLIDHICHVLLMASDVGEFSSESRHGRFLNSTERAIEADRNPAPLNHDVIAVALAPLLGHDPLLLEKVVCAIPRYKMSFSQMFGSYGTGQGEFTEPSGLAVLKDGRLAVVDTNQHRIMIFRDDKHLDLCFSSDEDAMQTDKLARLELDKQIRSGAARNRRWNGYLMYPNRAAVDPNTGHLVLTERAPHPQVQVFTENGQFVRRFGEGYLENPRGLCVDSLSRIIVVECKIMRVTIWSSTQLQKDFIATDLGFPNSIAADSQQRLYITDNEAHCVRIFSYSGQPLGSIGGPGLTNFPVAVRLRPCDDAICVFDNHNNFNMTVFTSDGALLEARESEIKHAQIHDVQLRPSDGAVIQAGKDYRVYVYKPYPFFLRGRDQRSPHLMNSFS